MVNTEHEAVERDQTGCEVGTCLEAEIPWVVSIRCVGHVQVCEMRQALPKLSKEANWIATAECEALELIAIYAREQSFTMVNIISVALAAQIE